MKALTKALGLITTLGMFIVLIMGSAVTNTGSEQGCGRSWPLCHGKLIPQMAVSTAIEFSHRAVVGIITILILALAIMAMARYRRRREIQILVPLMVVFLFAQAGLGAWAVMYPQEAAILALHFGVSLISFASVLLTTAFLFEVEGRDRLRDGPIGRGFRLAVWMITAYSYVVVYLGAYVRHAKADMACHGWPLCNGQVVPALNGSVGANVLHRFAAGVLALAIVGLCVWSWRFRATRPDLFAGSIAALASVLLQSLSGAVVVFTKLDLFSALAHAALAGLMFGSLTYLCMHVVRRRAAEEIVSISSPAPRVSHSPAGARR